MLEKLRFIQQNLKAPKNQTNKFGGYNYRSCEDILEAVKPLLEEKGMVLQLTDELVQIGDRYYIKATAKLYDENGQVENTAYAREEENKKGMDGSQITGASSSYARKYALNGLFLIDDVKDSDSTNVGEDKEPTEEDAKNWIFTFGKHNGEKLEDVLLDDEQYVDWFIRNKASEYDKKCYELLTGVKLPSEEELKRRLELTVKIKDLMINKNIMPEEITDKFNKTSKEMNSDELQEVVDWMVNKK